MRVVRSQSAFGFSMIYVVFEDNVDLYFARTRVLERMSLVTKRCRAGVVPTLGPDATGVGHVFWYTLEGAGPDLAGSAHAAGLVHSAISSIPCPASPRSPASVAKCSSTRSTSIRTGSVLTALPLSAVVAAVLRSN